MALESQFTEEQLFDQLISSIVHSAWVALGKIKNPLSDKVDRDLRQASVSIDMLDMLFKRMDGNLSEQEDQYLGHLLSELKMNYIDEKKKGDTVPEEVSGEDREAESETAEETPEPVEAKEKSEARAQKKAAPKKPKKSESKTAGKKTKATPRKKTAKKPKE
jgi:hypothetical protein